jgi:hypothetical protein
MNDFAGSLGQDPAAVMIALGALMRRGIDRAVDEGRDDEADFEESERFMETWLALEERRLDRRTLPAKPTRWGQRSFRR